MGQQPAHAPAQAPGPVIETARLILRPTAAADFERWAEMMADPVAARFIGGAQAHSAAWRGFAAMAGAWVLQGRAMFSAIERASGQWVGRIGPWTPEGWLGTEIGWGLHRAAWGKGYAREAAVATIDWAFDALGWDEVIHCIDPANDASAALAARLGAAIRGRARLPAPYEHLEVDIWAQSRADWRRRRAAGLRENMIVANPLAPKRP